MATGEAITTVVMSESKDSNPFAYILEILTITNNEGIYMDVRNMMGQCRIYEAITK